MDDQEAVERLDDDPVVRRHGGAGLAVVRVLLDETLRAGLVDGPRFLEVFDGLGDALAVEPGINLLADPTDALGESERHGEHLAVPAGDDRVRVGHRGHVDHAVFPDLLNLPRTPADDEVQALAGLDHHELLAEDANLPLRRQIENRIAALIPDRREVLEVIAAALRGYADLTSFSADDAKVAEELGDAVRLGGVEFAKRFAGANRREDVGPWRGASLVESATGDLMSEDIKGESMDMERLEVLSLRGFHCGEGLDRVVRGNRQDQPAGGAIERVARAADPLDKGRDLTGRVVLDDSVDGPDVDAEFQSTCGYEPFDLSAFETRLDPLSFFPRERAVVDRDVLADHGETGT